MGLFSSRSSTSSIAQDNRIDAKENAGAFLQHAVGNTVTITDGGATRDALEANVAVAETAIEEVTKSNKDFFSTIKDTNKRNSDNFEELLDAAGDVYAGANEVTVENIKSVYDNFEETAGRSFDFLENASKSQANLFEKASVNQSKAFESFGASLERSNRTTSQSLIENARPLVLMGLGIWGLTSFFDLLKKS